MSDQIISYQASPIRSTLFWPVEDGKPSVHISLARSLSELPSSLSHTTSRPSNASKEPCRVIRATPESTRLLLPDGVLFRIFVGDLQNKKKLADELISCRVIYLSHGLSRKTGWALTAICRKHRLHEKILPQPICLISPCYVSTQREGKGVCDETILHDHRGKLTFMLL